MALVYLSEPTMKGQTEISIIFNLLGLCLVSGHGILWDPPNRSSLWRFGYDTPVNYDDHQYYCGGISSQIGEKMKCGICGDAFDDPRPRSNENGGLYGLGITTRIYRQNSVIPVTAKLKVSHKGYFEFHVCNLDAHNETEECFQKLSYENGATRHYVTESGYHMMRVQLPKNLNCRHCVIRWHYKTGNNWGVCEDGSEAMGCGPQEIYRNCADVSIVPNT